MKQKKTLNSLIHFYPPFSTVQYLHVNQISPVSFVDNKACVTFLVTLTLSGDTIFALNDKSNNLKFNSGTAKTALNVRKKICLSFVSGHCKLSFEIQTDSGCWWVHMRGVEHV